MTEIQAQTYTAFEGHRILIQGRLDEVALRVKHRTKTDPSAAILIFSDLTGKEMDFDLRGSDKEILSRLLMYLTPKGEISAPPVGPGRPKLGVVAREVSLLPQHWEWLSTQSGGASATLRRLVEDAKKSASGKDLIKQAQERAYKFMSAMAGNLPYYEESLRALFAKDKKKFKECVVDWPKDVRQHALSLAAPVFT